MEPVSSLTCTLLEYAKLVLGPSSQCEQLRSSLDGKRLIRDEQAGPLADPEAVGRDLAHKLKDQRAGEILQEIFEQERGQ